MFKSEIIAEIDTLRNDVVCNSSISPADRKAICNRLNGITIDLMDYEEPEENSMVRGTD